MSRLPASIREAVQTAAAEHEPGARIVSEAPVHGGCINHGTRVSLDSGTDLFVKWNASAPPGIFGAEAAGVAALRSAVLSTGAPIRVPAVVATGQCPEGAWLALEFVPSGSSGDAAWEALGHGLAAIHAVASVAPAGSGPGGPDVGAPERSDRFGWPHDNWIGRLRQSNRGHAAWHAFWSEERIGPQLEHARRAGACHHAVFDRVLALTEAALAGVDTPSLLHGDLWSGNAFVSGDGRPVLVDPAVYRGDGEVDLAMSELFGGFDPRFYAAYDAVRPISAAYRSHRRDLYQLYYLLVHVNLFGGSYQAGAVATAERVVAAVG